jgi:hypothetical protein
MFEVSFKGQCLYLVLLVCSETSQISMRAEIYLASMSNSFDIVGPRLVRQYGV